MILITTAYPEPSELRRVELREALYRNIRSRLFDKIIVCVEGKPAYLPKSAALTLVSIPSRATYNLLFRQAPSGQIIVAANSDIFFDETLKQLETYDLVGKFLAVSRHSLDRHGQPGGLHGHPYQSQDAWIYLSPLVKINGDIPMGLPGCDQRIAYEAKAAGLLVLNPCLSINAFHIHGSRIRHYTQQDRLVGPYMKMATCKLEEKT